MTCFSQCFISYLASPASQSTSKYVAFGRRRTPNKQMRSTCIELLALAPGLDKGGMCFELGAMASIVNLFRCPSEFLSIALQITSLIVEWASVVRLSVGEA